MSDGFFLYISTQWSLFYEKECLTDVFEESEWIKERPQK